MILEMLPHLNFFLCWASKFVTYKISNLFLSPLSLPYCFLNINTFNIIIKDRKISAWEIILTLTLILEGSNYKQERGGN